jgi:hypothetical protein
MSEIKLPGKEDPKEKLGTLVDALIAVGILLMIIAILDYILELLQNPFYILVSSVENILIKVLGESVAVLLSFVIILFIAAGIVKIGTFLKDKEEIEVYRSLIYLFWIGDLIVLSLLGIAYMMRLVSASFVVGIGFTLFIAPLISTGILEGLEYLIKIFSQ